MTKPFVVPSSLHLYSRRPNPSDIDECGTTQCDAASTECENTPGAFFCKCKKGYEPNLNCRPMGDLGISDGGIPDDAIEVSSTAEGFQKNVS